MNHFVKTGIPGLDEILKGGLILNSSVLVTGAPGTGKSILALQFIIQGAKDGEPGLYITSEEPASMLRAYARNIGLNLEPYEKRGLITIYEQPITGKILSIEAPLTLIKKNKVKRVVIDSLTLFEYAYAHDPHRFEFRKAVLSFIADMQNINLLATSERKTTDLDNFMFDDQDFIFDGVIIMSKIRKGASFERVITVAKMRGQEHLLDIFPLKIAKGGCKVLTKQLPFSLIEKESSQKF